MTPTVVEPDTRAYASEARQRLGLAGQNIAADIAERRGIAPEAAGEVVREALAAMARDGARGDDVTREAERLRVSRDARGIVERENAEADLRLPPQRDDYSLGAYLAEDRPARIERIESLQRESHKTLLVAGFKTGKTTLHANLTRALTDGTKFLGRFAVQRPQGRVGIWNGEMEPEDFQDYLSDAGVTKTDDVAIWNLRGFRLPLTSDAACEAAVKWLKDNRVSYWIVDPWSKVCSWSGVDENVNAEVAPLLQKIDEIASDAGVAEVLIVHHAGHVKGRPRGATVLPDWADGIWLYSRDENSDKRYFRAEGRGIGLPEGLVEFDELGHVVYRQASRKEAKMQGMARDVAEYVASNPGCTTTEAQDSLTLGNNAEKPKAVREAIKQGLIREEKDPDDGRRKLLFYVPQSSGEGIAL